MKKILTIVLFILLFLCICGCSKTNDNEIEQNIENNNNKNDDINEIAETSIDEIQDSIPIFPIWVESKETIKIRAGSSTSYNRVGYVRPGDKFKVFERIENENYTWNRIGENEWIADDGTWLTDVTETRDNKFNLFSFKKLPSSVTIDHLEYSKDRIISTIYIDIYKDSSENIVGYNEIWNYGTDKASNHPGDIYRFGTIQHPYYGKGVKHEYDVNGNIILEKLSNSFTKEYVYNESEKLVKIINYQSGYPSLDLAIVSHFEYNDSNIVEKQYWQDNELITNYTYMLNGSIVFQYGGYVGDVEDTSSVVSQLYSSYRFDLDGDIAETFDLGGDHCYINSLYKY